MIQMKCMTIKNSAESCNRELKNKTSFENKLVGSGNVNDREAKQEKSS